MLDQIEKIAKIIGVLVACFGVWTYYDALHQKTVDRTLDYFDVYHTGEVFKAREAIAVLSYRWRNTTNEDGAALTLAELRALTVDELQKVENRILVDIVLEFFNRINVCIKNGGCAAEVADGLFQREARTFFIFTAPFVEARQTDSPKFAQGLMCLKDGPTSQACQS